MAGAVVLDGIDDDDDAGGDDNDDLETNAQHSFATTNFNPSVDALNGSHVIAYGALVPADADAVEPVVDDVAMIHG